jgi:hypothetical protein
MGSGRRLLALAFLVPVLGGNLVGVVGRGFPGGRYFAGALLPALSLLAMRRRKAQPMSWAVAAVALALPILIERLFTMAVRCPVVPLYEYRDMQVLGAAFESRALSPSALRLRGPYAQELVAGLSPFIPHGTGSAKDDIRVLRVSSEVRDRLGALGWTTISLDGDAIAFSSLTSRLRLDHARTCLRITEETRCADLTPEAWRELDDPTRWATAYDTLRPFSALLEPVRAAGDFEVEITQRVPLANGNDRRVIRLFSSGFDPPWDIVAVDDAEFDGALPARCVVLGGIAGSSGAITFRLRGGINDLPLMLTPLFLEMTEAEDAALAATLTDSLVVRAATKKQMAPCPNQHGTLPD